MLLSTFSFNLAFSSINTDSEAIYTFYTIGDCSDLKNVQVIKNGNSNIIRTQKKHARNTRKCLTNVLGESVSFKGDLLEFSLIKDEFEAEVLIDESIENEMIIYSGFSSKHQKDLKNIMIDGMVINFQLAYNKGTITIGTPVILGDY